MQKAYIEGPYLLVLKCIFCEYHLAPQITPCPCESTSNDSHIFSFSLADHSSKPLKTSSLLSVFLEPSLLQGMIFEVLLQEMRLPLLQMHLTYSDQ